MKKSVIKSVVLVITFVLAITCFSLWNNQTIVDQTVEMSEASLPLISLKYKNHPVANLHGYITEMDMKGMRDNIVPIDETRKIKASVQLFGQEVADMSYEIRSLDGERLIANTKLTEYEKENGTISLEILFQNFLSADQEYQLHFILSLSDGRQVNYYTRLMQLSDSKPMDECIDFVWDFHENTLEDGNVEALATYIEPDGSVDNRNLHKVNIHANLNQMGWADFNHKLVGEPTMRVAEIADFYQVFIINYMICHESEDGENQFYNVEDYYRVRYGEDVSRCYLLSYERTTNQILSADNRCMTENRLLLGIRDADVHYKKSENGSITCFVQEGDLWSYRTNNGVLYRVFSFRSMEGVDERENITEHDIQILRVDEGGSINFAVYGYMNRGAHEGQVGVAVYRFDSVSNAIEELLFVPYNQSYYRLKGEMSELLYQNARGGLFLQLAGRLYRMNLDVPSFEVVADGIESVNMHRTKDGNLVAWQQQVDGTTGIELWDLEKEKQTILTAGYGETLVPIGFLAEDFVYGVRKSDGKPYEDGEIPFSKVIIYDTTAMMPVKTYEKPGYYVYEAIIEDYVIVLNRLKKGAISTYAIAESDSIMNQQGEALIHEEIMLAYDEIKQNEVELKLDDYIGSEQHKLVVAGEVLQNTLPVLELDNEPQSDYYYVYAEGELICATSILKEAIGIANETMGVVVDERQNAVWKRAKKVVQSAIAVPSPEDALEEDGDDHNRQLEFEDFSGITLSEALYFVHMNRPVLAGKPESATQWIVGYDSSNVTIYDSQLDLTEKKELALAEKEYGLEGNQFYVLKPKPIEVEE